MKSMEEWNRCLDLLLSGALQDLHTTQEYEYRKNRREYIDKMLDADLTRDQKTTIDEVLLELESDAERQTQQMYRQGFRDCVLMLKKTGGSGIAPGPPRELWLFWKNCAILLSI